MQATLYCLKKLVRVGIKTESERLQGSPSVDCVFGVSDHFLRSHKTNWSRLFLELEVNASVTSFWLCGISTWNITEEFG